MESKTIKCKLGEIAKLKYGKMPKKEKKVENGYSIYTGYKISGSYSEYMYEKPQLIIVARGVGGTGDVKLAPPYSYITNLAIIIEVDSNVADQYYLKYYLNSLNLRYLDSGSAQSQITINDLNNLKIELPDIVYQKKVAKFLNIIEVKLSINSKIILNLENLTNTLYKHWFTNFEFPNQNGEPYKSSGGEMIESELGEIPEAWSIETLSSIAKKVGDSIKVEKLEKVVPYIGLEHMPRGSIALSSWETSEKVTSNKNSYQKGDILFGKLRPYFKKVGFAPLDGICSTDIVVFNSKKPHYYSYLMCVVSRDEFIDYCNATATGTRMPRTGWNQMTKYKVIMPPADIAKLFNEHNKSFYERINALIHENNNLKSLRDILLPKLLSGEIELLDETEVTEYVPIL
ncbi:restriction endonuclease subunit S [Planococcus maritimus]|nr:restriction endonuclease subunit S [Planococcus sp. SK3692]MDE4084641.1 restriction endonuclease subunit S [Planococcus maritimus]